MDEREIEEIAARVVKKLVEPANCSALAEAVAKELRRLATQYASDMQKIGETLEGRHF